MRCTGTSQPVNGQVKGRSERSSSSTARTGSVSRFQARQVVSEVQQGEPSSGACGSCGAVNPVAITLSEAQPTGRSCLKEGSRTDLVSHAVDASNNASSIEAQFPVRPPSVLHGPGETETPEADRLKPPALTRDRISFSLDVHGKQLPISASVPYEHEREISNVRSLSEPSEHRQARKEVAARFQIKSLETDFRRRGSHEPNVQLDTSQQSYILFGNDPKTINLFQHDPTANKDTEEPIVLLEKVFRVDYLYTAPSCIMILNARDQIGRQGRIWIEFSSVKDCSDFSQHLRKLKPSINLQDRNESVSIELSSSASLELVQLTLILRAWIETQRKIFQDANKNRSLLPSRVGSTSNPQSNPSTSPQCERQSPLPATTIQATIPQLIGPPEHAKARPINSPWEEVITRSNLTLDVQPAKQVEAVANSPSKIDSCPQCKQTLADDYDENGKRLSW